MYGFLIGTPLFEWLAASALLLLLFVIHAAVKKQGWRTVSIAMARFLAATAAAILLFANYNAGGVHTQPVLWIVLVATILFTAHGFVTVFRAKRPATAATFWVVLQLQVMAVIVLIARQYAPDSVALACRSSAIYLLLVMGVIALLVYTVRTIWWIGKRLRSK